MVSTRELAVEAQARGFDSIFRFRRHSGHGRTSRLVRPGRE